MRLELDRSRPLYFVSQSPPGWLDNSLPKFRKYTAPNVEPANAGNNQTHTWKETTGLMPEDSHLTVVVPVHNEEKFLPSLIGTLMLSDIPDGVDMNVVFVTNVCNQENLTIIRNFMQLLSPISVDMLSDEEKKRMFNDEKLDNTVYRSHLGSIKFIHMNTQTKGKPNALNIGNRIALLSDHPIAISIDANNFLEPDAIARIYAKAYQKVIHEKDGTAILSGKGLTDIKPTRFECLFRIFKANMKNIGRNQSAEVGGWLMAWDTKWLESIGGVPPVANNDYALGVYARYTGRKIDHVEEALIWGFEPNNLSERLEQYIRSVRGRMQLMAYNPALRDMITTDIHYMGNIGQRWQSLIEWISQNPGKSPFILLKFLMFEYAIIMARNQFRNNPSDPSWVPIRSTKT